MVAGPLVLWDDNVVYAITSRGGVTLPANSTPAILLGDLEAAGYTVVRVEEKTIIGGWRGPIYRMGMPHITGWASVWSDREGRERVFLVVSKDSERKVHEIHEALAGDTAGASNEREHHHGMRSLTLLGHGFECDRFLRGQHQDLPSMESVR
jgi:hypothetical protein